MKNYQKNPKNLFTAFSCMLEELMTTFRANQMNGIWNIHIWSLILNLGFKPTSFKSLIVALAQITSFCHVIFMHHTVALH